MGTETSERGKPALTVLLPVYNAASSLEAAARSVLTGNLTPIELIIIDDGSTDGSASVARRIAEDPRVRIISHENKGLSASLNEGIAAASTPIVARMDADDVSAPGRLDAQFDFLHSHDSVVLVGGQIRRMVAGFPLSQSRFPTAHAAIVRQLLSGQHALCHPTIMARKTALESVGGYWHNGVAEDWDLFLRLSEIGRIANLPQLALDYSFHCDGINASSMFLVRTNIRLAIQNHELRARGLAELDQATFLAQLTRWVRLRIRLETLSLSLYRRSLLARSSRPIRSTALLAAAAGIWPPFTVQRIARAVAVAQFGTNAPLR